ncbi:MAG: hypothetical protein ABI537_07775 [Casimicrobiaceae bacterium]
MTRRNMRPDAVPKRPAEAAPATPASTGKPLLFLLVYVLPALALFACVWVTRVFVSAEIVAGVLQMTGLRAIALVAVFGGLLPALPLGIGYGLLWRGPVYGHAFAVAALAALCELAFASLTVPWWSFFTWWVLPLEGATLLAMFPVAASIGARLFTSVASAARRRVGVAIFIAMTLCAIALPWVLGQASS